MSTLHVWWRVERARARYPVKFNLLGHRSEVLLRGDILFKYRIFPTTCMLLHNTLLICNMVFGVRDDVHVSRAVNFQSRTMPRDCVYFVTCCVCVCGHHMCWRACVFVCGSACSIGSVCLHRHYVRSTYSHTHAHSLLPTTYTKHEHIPSEMNVWAYASPPPGHKIYHRLSDMYRDMAYIY